MRTAALCPGVCQAQDLAWGYSREQRRGLQEQAERLGAQPASQGAALPPSPPAVRCPHQPHVGRKQPWLPGWHGQQGGRALLIKFQLFPGEYPQQCFLCAQVGLFRWWVAAGGVAQAPVTRAGHYSKPGWGWGSSLLFGAAPKHCLPCVSRGPAFSSTPGLSSWARMPWPWPPAWGATLSPHVSLLQPSSGNWGSGDSVYEGGLGSAIPSGISGGWAGWTTLQSPACCFSPWLYSHSRPF